jgi:hypothetical protein
VQLSIALNVGFLVPLTVMTNSKAHIPSAFLEEDRQWVHKSFLPHVWIDGSVTRHTATSLMQQDLGAFSEDAFSTAPGIFQHRIQKQHDVRVVMFSNDFHAFQISTGKSGASLDWRPELLKGRASVDRIEMPLDIRQKLVDFSKIAGLVHGSFDFVVDLDDQWWFLEVNQSGQILWIDDQLPTDGTFQPMLRFLSHGQECRIGPGDSNYPTYFDVLANVVLPDCQEEVTDETKYATIEK